MCVKVCHAIHLANRDSPAATSSASHDNCRARWAEHLQSSRLTPQLGRRRVVLLRVFDGGLASSLRVLNLPSALAQQGAHVVGGLQRPIELLLHLLTRIGGLAKRLCRGLCTSEAFLSSAALCRCRLQAHSQVPVLAARHLERRRRPGQLSSQRGDSACARARRGLRRLELHLAFSMCCTDGIVLGPQV